ncbi:SRPBCC family protein [Ulvibacterium marinum]|uniref:SRPBCC family protein n=1 Tax=Ulvibacterium marinum TaxID=2419782 RepID=A0A3B0CH94_9FLAO|nr:SRPBCC family protein [Ulvibacterium marinum]RKN82546.1 SRPBCC family protein [Ulvibacterium marinum]
MKINKTLRVNAPAARVWEILYTNYGDACDWASTVNESKERMVAGSEYVGRTCSTVFGDVSEIIDRVDEDSMELQYHLDDTPFIMKAATAKWKVEPLSTNTSSVTIDLDLTLATVPGLLMGWMIKPKMRKDIFRTMEDLKYYIETGKQSEAKVKSDAKYFRKKGKEAA